MDLVVSYVNALFLVFMVVIFVRILLSWVPTAPVRPAARAVWDFFHQSTDWYLNVFRRVLPPIGMFDLSPIVALIVLFILRALVTNVLESF